MDDRELLELAAKARFGNFANQMLESLWGPEHDNAEAFELAVDLGMDISTREGDGFGDHCSWAESRINGSLVMSSVLHRHDATQATRLAILKTAAKIGESLEAKDGG